MIYKVFEKFSLGFIGFLQASGLVVYCSLVGLLFWRGGTWFGSMTSFLGPMLFLALFVASALISALLVLGYPVILFFEKKQATEALKLVAYTTAWLILFVLFLIFLFIAF